MLQHGKILLRKLELADKSELAKQVNNKKIWDNLRDYIPHPYGEKDAVDFINLTAQQNPQLNFCIAFDGKLAGMIGLVPQQDIYRKSAEIGYWLGEEFWGKGIATVAVKLVTEYGFNTLKLVRLFAGVFEHNSASMRVLEKNGFVKEGIGRKAVFKNGKILDEHRYAIVRD